MTHFFWIIWNIVRNVKGDVHARNLHIPEARQDESYKLTQSKSFSIIWIQHEMKFQYIRLVCIVFKHDYTYWQAQTTNAQNVFNSTRNAAAGTKVIYVQAVPSFTQNKRTCRWNKSKTTVNHKHFRPQKSHSRDEKRKIDFEASERKIWVTGEIRRSLSTIQFANKSSL